MEWASLPRCGGDDVDLDPRHLRVALIGAGMFTQQAYIPLMHLYHNHVRVVYVWSRSEEAADSVVQHPFNLLIDTVAKHGKQGFKEILDDPCVDAVLVILPTHASLQYALKALAAGKAVLSEKPISIGVREAHKALARASNLHAALPVPPPWFVAENFRFETVFEEAARIVRGLGFVVRIDLMTEAPAHHRYFESKWRCKQSSHAFMIHAGAQHMAALRLLAAAAKATNATSIQAKTFYNERPVRPSSERHSLDTADVGDHMDTSGSGESSRGTAAFRQAAPATPAAEGSPGAANASEKQANVPQVPRGTATGVSATVSWDSGLVSTVWLCMVAEEMRYDMSVVGLQGTLEIVRGDCVHGDGRYVLSYRKHGAAQPMTQAYNVAGIKHQFEAFLEVAEEHKLRLALGGSSPLSQESSGSYVSEGSPIMQTCDSDSLKPRNRFDYAPVRVPEWRGSPGEAANDLELIAAMLISGDTGRTVQLPEQL